MKSAVVALGVVVAACAAYVGAAVVGGQKVEKHLRGAVVSAQTQWPMIRITDEKYDHSLFGATHTFTIRAACDPADAGASAPKGITIVQHIKNGPFPGFKGFGAATIDTDVALDAVSRQEVVKLFGNDHPFTAHTDVAYTGASRTHFAIQRFHTAGPKGETVDFGGLTADVDNSDSALEYDLRMPVMSVTDAASSPAGVHLDFKGMHLHARAEGGGELMLRPAKAQGELESMEFGMAAPDTGTAHKVGFSQVKFSQDTTIDKNLMNATAHLDGVGQIDDTKLDRIELVSTMKRFDAATYQGLVRKIVGTDGQCGKKPDPARLLGSPEVQAAVLQMLSANPEISLDKLVVQVGNDRAELAYAIGVEGFTANDAKLPMVASLMTRGYGNLKLKLPEPWIQKSMNYIAQQSGQASGATNQAAMVDLTLNKVIDQGYVVREEGMLRSEMAFKAGQATINGKPVGRPMAPPADGAPAPAAM